jgi:enoyl-CoA hydratase
VNTYASLLIDIRDEVAWVTINRPKSLNALDASVLEDLDQAFGELKIDPTVKAVILTGAGEKAFVAGADISKMAEMNSAALHDYAYRAHSVFMAIDDFPKPVIAAVNGFALGGGCELAMACDIRVASETARFGQPEVNLGTMPFFGGTQRLSRLVGKGMANYLVLTAEMITAQEAQRIGLCELVVPPGELLAKAQTIATTILAKSQVAVRAALTAISSGLNTDLKSGVVIEVESAVTTFTSEDMAEGLAAFLEKRPPVFPGK